METVSSRLPRKKSCSIYGRVPDTILVQPVNTLSVVDFDSFSKVLNRPGGFRDPGDPEQYCKGFQVFDKDGTGFIGVGQLRYST